MPQNFNEIIKYSPLVFYGQEGQGYFDFLKKVKEKFNGGVGSKYLKVTAEKFLAELVSAIANGKKKMFDKKYRENDLLIIEGIELLANKERTSEELLIILKDLQIKNHQVVLTTNEHPKLIKELDNDLVKSCFGGLVLEK